MRTRAIWHIDAKEILQVLPSKKMDVSRSTAYSCVMRTTSIVEHMKVVLEQIKETERQIDRSIRSLSEKGWRQGEVKPSNVEILNSVPGVVRVVLATIFGEAYELVYRRDYKSLRIMEGSWTQSTIRTG